MHIDVLLSPTVTATREQLEKTIVVIDVLRATSTIATALANGAMEVIPVADPSEAIQLAKRLGDDQCLTGGERGGLPIPGLNLGNSPREYTCEVVNGMKLALCTSNGTHAIRWAQAAKKVYTASFLNLNSVVRQLEQENTDVLLVCSGSDGGFAMEDLYCAGRIIQEISAQKMNLALSDAAKLAKMAAQSIESIGLEKALSETEHGKNLYELGLGDDVTFCAQVNYFTLVPVYIGGRIIKPELG